MKVTDKDVSRLVAKWAKAYKLDPAWSFSLKINESPDHEDEDQVDAAASIYVEEGYFIARLIVNTWRIDSLKELDHVICHEIAHVVLAPMWTLLRSLGGNKLDEVCRNALEAATERFARAMLGRK